MNTQESRYLKAIKAVLSPALINPKFAGKVDHPMCGHCHHASLALYTLLGGKNKGYKLQRAQDELGITHYWVVNASGQTLDPTAEQYTELGRPLPYHNKVNNQASYLPTKSSRRIVEMVMKSIRA